MSVKMFCLNLTAELVKLNAKKEYFYFLKGSILDQDFLSAASFTPVLKVILAVAIAIGIVVVLLTLFQHIITE